MVNTARDPLSLVSVGALSAVLLLSLFEGNNQTFAHSDTPNIQEDSLLVTAAPSSVSRDGIVTITATVSAHRTGPETDTDWSVELTVPAGYTIGSGANPQVKTTSSHGSAVASWNVTAPATPSGPDTFTVTASATDASLGTPLSGSPEADTFEITTINTNPVAADDLVTIAEDASLTISVLSNDTDADNDALLISSVSSPPANGTALITDTNTTLTYSPDANFFGIDNIGYTIQDGFGGTATGTITVIVTTVNDDPVANDDSILTPEDNAKVIAVLANDIDVDNDSSELSVVSVTPPSSGMAVMDGNNITYTPNQDFNGIDVFSYTISDGAGGTASATVTVNVTSLNDVPVAHNSSATVYEDNQVTITLEGSDVDGDILTFAIAAGPFHGALAEFNSATGLVTYVPEAEYNGQDSFTFIVTDNSANSTTAIVTITVDPVAEEDEPQTESRDGERRDRDRGPQRIVRDHSYIESHPLGRMKISDVEVMDEQGRVATQLRDGMNVILSVTARNYQAMDQNYTMFVQTTDENGVAVSIIQVRASIDGGGQEVIEAVWEARSGSYLATAFLTDGDVHPTIISEIFIETLVVE